MDTLIHIAIAGAFIVGAIKGTMSLFPKANPKIVCKFCGVTGRVTVQDVDRKQGISGGKATGAVLTGGASLLVTGLSKVQGCKQLACGNCGMEWDVQ